MEHEIAIEFRALHFELQQQCQRATDADSHANLIHASKQRRSAS